MDLSQQSNVSAFEYKSLPQLKFLVWDSNLNLHFKILKAIKKTLALFLTVRVSTAVWAFP